jgi:hypothetical protein
MITDKKLDGKTVIITGVNDSINILLLYGSIKNKKVKLIIF